MSFAFDRSLRTKVRAALLAVVTALVWIAPAQADDESFTLHNKSSHTMVALYVGPTTDDNWGPNILSGKAGPGEDVTVTWTKSAPDVCEWDVRGEYADGATAEVRNVDFCKVTDVTFHD
jgi:hypothetical protein